MPSDRRPWALAATIVGSSLAFIDSTAVNVALPALQRDLHADVSALQWIVEIYLLFLGCLILVGGVLGDRYGRRRIYALGIVLFAAASLACGLAPSSGTLIAARALQGIGGALLVPGSLAIISAAYQGEARGHAIGTWSGFTAITTALGQVLGGWLVDRISWRAIFFLNVPMAVLTLAMVAFAVEESRDPNAPDRLDWAGVATATLGLGGLAFGLTEGPTRGWTHLAVLGAIALGVVALVAFVLVEARSKAPMMPLSLFRSPTFSGANGLTLLLYAALGGAMFFIPYTLIQVHGYSATAAGAAMLPFIVLMFSLSRWAGGLIHRHGAKLPLVVGPAIAAVGFALFALPGTSGSYWTTFFPAIAVLGLGMSVAVAPLTTAVMGAVSTEKAGVASGVNNAVSRVGGLIAVALFGAVIVAVFGQALDQRLTAASVPVETRLALTAHRERLAELAPPEGAPEVEKWAIATAVDEAYVAGFRVAMGLAAALALASAGVAARWVGARPGDGHENS